MKQGYELKQKQSLPLEQKIIITQQRIRKWYEYWDEDVYVSFSGGKDSTVLLNIAREMYPGIPAVFVDTGLEYQEVKEFVNSFDNITTLRPKLSFIEVIEKYGFPLISKEQAQYIQQYRTAKSEKTKYTRWYGNKWGQGKISEKWKFLVDAPFKISDQCCGIMKKKPCYKYEKETGQKPIVGILACESCKRIQDYNRFGCNAFSAKRPISRPLAIWTEQDILQYLKQKNISISSIYGDIIETDCGDLRLTGVDRTGCMFCMFGVHLEKEPNRFQRMKITHPKIYDYCINKLGIGRVLDFIGVKY